MVYEERKTYTEKDRQRQTDRERGRETDRQKNTHTHTCHIDTLLKVEVKARERVV